MSTKHITIPIVFNGRYCDEGACPMHHNDDYNGDFCAAFGVLDRTKGDHTRQRWPKSIRHVECVKQAKTTRQEPSR